jgi:ribosomal protein S18 acetylase RimI-like enzyme
MEPCPFLPLPDRPFTHDDIHALGADRSERFYFTAMSYAQALWLAAFPAKALLLVNRALSCALPQVLLHDPGSGEPGYSPAPYHAKAWIMHYRAADKFIGNPCRHYQHLATRMVEPHKELRTWRAWACWYLAKELLPESEFPPDTQQVREEQVVKPTRALIAEQLARWSPSDDLSAWQDALAMAHRWTRKDAPAPVPDLTFRLIAHDELEVVRRLSHEIWPVAYREMISAEQIRYMLERMYAPDELRQEMVVRGVKYALLESAGCPCGYMAWELVPNDRSIFLHKLYVKPELHGRGVGAASLRWLVQEAGKENATCIRLRVNRNNHRAIRAYLRAGFTFGHDLVSDIGGGFVMDDHVMVKILGQ